MPQELKALENKRLQAQQQIEFYQARIFKASRLRFSFILDFVHPKSTPCTPLDKSSFAKCVQLLLQPIEQTPCTTSLLHQEDALVQCFL